MKILLNLNGKIRLFNLVFSEVERYLEKSEYVL